MRETPGSIPGSPNPVFFPEHRPLVALFHSHEPSGHFSVAEALRHELLLTAPKIQVANFAFSSDFHPVLGPFITKFYLQIIQRAPALWRFCYDHRGIAIIARKFHPLLRSWTSRRLDRWLASRNHDVVICTHAIACAALALEKTSGRSTFPLVAVLTDYGVHDYWISPQVDLYLAPTSEVRSELMRRGIESFRIRVTGIPVHRNYRYPIPVALARKELGIQPERPTVLISGGSKGMGPLLAITKKLLSTIPGLQVIAACGGNVRLYRTLQQYLIKEAMADHLVVLSFTHRMDLCLSAADLFIGKAGGVSVAEATALGVPMVLIAPLPGQEERNVEALSSCGGAVFVKDLQDLPRLVDRLLQSGECLRRMKHGVRSFGKPDSAEAACQEILGLLAEKNKFCFNIEDAQTHRTGVGSQSRMPQTR